MPRPTRYALYENKKEKLAQIQQAWARPESIMEDETAPAGVRADVTEKRLDRLIGKAPQRIEVSEDIPQHQQMMAQIRRTPEGRAAVRELVRQMREAAKLAIDVTSSGTTED